MSRFQFFIDTLDISDCSMIVLPSLAALENEELEYFDDYYVDIMLTSIEGNLHRSIAKEPQEKNSVATVHIKVCCFPA